MNLTGENPNICVGFIYDKLFFPHGIIYTHNYNLQKFACVKTESRALHSESTTTVVANKIIFCWGCCFYF